MTARVASWAVMAVVIVTVFAVAATGDRAPTTAADRVERVASEVKCPTCRGLSVADSDAKASNAIREEIRQRVQAGQSDADIRAYLVSRYGDGILLRPAASGLAGLVWALPVVAVIVGAVAVGYSVRRSRPVEVVG